MMKINLMRIRMMKINFMTIPLMKVRIRCQASLRLKLTKNSDRMTLGPEDTRS